MEPTERAPTAIRRTASRGREVAHGPHQLPAARASALHAPRESKNSMSEHRAAGAVRKCGLYESGKCHVQRMAREQRCTRHAIRQSRTDTAGIYRRCVLCGDVCRKLVGCRRAVAPPPPRNYGGTLSHEMGQPSAEARPEYPAVRRYDSMEYRSDLRRSRRRSERYSKVASHVQSLMIRHRGASITCTAPITVERGTQDVGSIDRGVEHDGTVRGAGETAFGVWEAEAEIVRLLGYTTGVARAFRANGRHRRRLSANLGRHYAGKYRDAFCSRICASSSKVYGGPGRT